jgi:hypothetical protein
MQVALEAADLGRNANKWASQFFAHGAIPAVVLHTDQMIPDNELERVSSAWDKLTRGVERAWRTIVLRKGLKPEIIQSPIKDLAMTELFEQIRNQIAVAFGVPQTMLSDAANYATAKEHRLSFYQDTVIPKARQIQAAMQEQIFDDLSLTFEFDFNAIEAIQKDEAEKAEYLRHLVEAKIITKDEARDMLGFGEMTPEQLDELKPGPLNLPPAGGSDNGSKPPEPPEPPVESEPVRAALTLAMEADLEKWQKKALAKGADAPFESEFIPAEMVAWIKDGLAGANGESEIKRVFGDVYWQAYP